MEKQYYSVDEALAILGISRPTLYKQFKTGAMPSRMLGGRRLIPRWAVDTNPEDTEEAHHGTQKATRRR